MSYSYHHLVGVPRPGYTGVGAPSDKLNQKSSCRINEITYLDHVLSRSLQSGHAT